MLMLYALWSQSWISFELCVCMCSKTWCCCWIHKSLSIKSLWPTTSSDLRHLIIKNSCLVNKDTPLQSGSLMLMHCNILSVWEVIWRFPSFVRSLRLAFVIVWRGHICIVHCSQKYILRSGNKVFLLLFILKVDHSMSCPVVSWSAFKPILALIFVLTNLTYSR